MRDAEETASQRVQDFSYPWSGRIEQVGRDLLMPWLDADHREAGSMWIPMERVTGMVEALLAHIPQDSEFVADLMRQALDGRVPSEDVDELAERTAAAALLVVEHALALAAKAQEVRDKAYKKAYGTRNVIPSGEHEKAL